MTRRPVGRTTLLLVEVRIRRESRDDLPVRVSQAEDHQPQHDVLPHPADIEVRRYPVRDGRSAESPHGPEGKSHPPVPRMFDVPVLLPPDCAQVPLGPDQRQIDDCDGDQEPLAINGRPRQKKGTHHEPNRRADDPAYGPRCAAIPKRHGREPNAAIRPRSLGWASVPE